MTFLVRVMLVAFTVSARSLDSGKFGRSVGDRKLCGSQMTKLIFVKCLSTFGIQSSALCRRSSSFCLPNSNFLRWCCENYSSFLI